MKKIIKFIRSLFLWRINPYALLAAHLRLKCYTYPIFINDKGEKYALTMHGFVLAERYNAQEQYRILDKDYKKLLEKYEEKKALLLQKTTANANLLVSLTDVLSKKRKSSLKKIINSDVSDADKLSQIKKLIES